MIPSKNYCSKFTVLNVVSTVIQNTILRKQNRQIVIRISCGTPLRCALPPYSSLLDGNNNTKILIILKRFKAQFNLISKYKICELNNCSIKVTKRRNRNVSLVTVKHLDCSDFGPNIDLSKPFLGRKFIFLYRNYTQTRLKFIQDFPVTKYF